MRYDLALDNLVCRFGTAELHVTPFIPDAKRQQAVPAFYGIITQLIDIFLNTILAVYRKNRAYKSYPGGKIILFRRFPDNLLAVAFRSSV